jgi:hypothetical protein
LPIKNQAAAYTITPATSLRGSVDNGQSHS